MNDHPSPTTLGTPDIAALPITGSRVGNERLLTLPEQIAERIYAAIVAGEYPPGQRIREEELAERFGVSRGPVREALRILEKDAVVRLQSNRGAHVTQLSAKEVNEIFEIRMLLAGAMIRRLRGCSADLIARLDASVRRLEAFASRPDGMAGYVAGVVQLGLMLAEASGNERLAEIMTSLARQSSRYTQLALASVERRIESAGNWRSMLEALRASEIERAAMAMEKLVDDARREAARSLQGRAADSMEKGR